MMIVRCRVLVTHGITSFSMTPERLDVNRDAVAGLQVDAGTRARRGCRSSMT